MINTQMYALLNPDLRRMGIHTSEQLQHHWNKRGQREKRPLTFHQKFPRFNHEQYRKNYPDIRHLSDPQLEIHFLIEGRRQNRTYQAITEQNSPESRNRENNSHLQVFTKIYENEIWGKSHTPEFKGSPGELSRFDYVAGNFTPFLRKFIEKNRIRSVVDVGCGNFDWVRPVYQDLNVQFTGYDVYEPLVRYNQAHHPEYTFHHLDAFSQREKLQPAELLILKDVLQHWSNNDIVTFLNFLVQTKKYKCVLIVNCSRQKEDNADIPTGGFRELSSQFLPLKQFRIKKIYDAGIKEISLMFT